MVVPRKNLSTTTQGGSEKEQQQQHNAETLREVKHHDKLAADWWNKNGPMAALHALNEIR